MSPPGIYAPYALATYLERWDTPCPDGTTAEQCAWAHSWWRFWGIADIVYSQPVVYFFCAAIGLFTAFNLIHRARQTSTGGIMALSLPTYTWVVAVSRSIFNRRYRLRKTSGYTLTTGEIIIVLGMILFFSVITLGPQPYYWPDMMYGMSPPIATRAGFLAIAILPFQVILASKWNYITILTGVSHEKLQVFHRWSGWVMHVLALMHTFPFIIVDIKYGVMESEWATNYFLWSGVLALVPQTILVTLSIACIRDRYYETFKSVHFVMAAFFIVALFVHVDFTLTSAYYFVALAAVYGTSLLFRLAIAFKNGFHHRAHLETLENDMLLVTIPTTLKWKPGQHYFFRFLTGNIHSFTSHPFTVASIPSPKGDSTIQIYMRVKGGMTAHLASLADGKSEARVLLDGPYGGVGGEMSVYDRALLVGGGSGGSFILSTLRHLAQTGRTAACKSITVVYSCHSLESSTWFKNAFEEVDSNSSDVSIEVIFHVSTLIDDGTATTALSTPALSTINDKRELEPLPTTSSSTVHHGRPDLPAHVEAAFGPIGTLGVVVCGPKEMDFDVRNTVAIEQMKIASGSVGCKECYLHSEAFGW